MNSSPRDLNLSAVAVTMTALYLLLRVGFLTNVLMVLGGSLGLCSPLG